MRKVKVLYIVIGICVLVSIIKIVAFKKYSASYDNEVITVVNNTQRESDYLKILIKKEGEIIDEIDLINTISPKDSIRIKYTKIHNLDFDSVNVIKRD